MNRDPQQILEELLVLQAQDGDAHAISQLVKTWHPRLIRYAVTIVGQHDGAIDAVQESWIAIWKGIRKVKDPAKFRSWAFRIVHNKSYDMIRSKIKQREAIDAASQMIASNTDNGGNGPTTETSDEKQQLQNAIAKLKPEDQTILGLYYQENLSIKEIEMVTGATVSAIKSRLDRLRKKLKTILKGMNHGK